MSDITAVVLSIGEETTARAIESVRRQALPVKEIITVENVSPFYRAFNTGVSKVTTEFFVQVDSDMILDENCVQDLRTCMQEEVGLVLGSLRDPLMGRIGWVKMFRTKCFESVQYKDVIAQDVVFKDDISQNGWKTVFAIRSLGGSPKELWHTFGDHRPAYTPHYTYAKYLVEGRRYRFRKASGGVVWHLKKLANSGHPVALIAQVALAHGIFIRGQGDLLKPYVPNEEFEFLQKFLTTDNSSDLTCDRILPWFGFSAKTVFQKSYRLGIRLRQAHAFPSFKRCLESLDASRDPLAWIAKIGLCHGLFSETYGADVCEEDYELFEDLLGEYHSCGIVKAKLRYFGFALLRRINSSYTFGRLRSRIDKTFGKHKLWDRPRMPSSN
jgi:hypothetical protein